MSVYMFSLQKTGMLICVITDDAMKGELLAQGAAGDHTVEWITSPLGMSTADCCIDLLFDGTPERIHQLMHGNFSCIIVNAVAYSPADLPPNFIRINGWPGFLKRSVTEASGATANTKENAERIFTFFNKTVEWTPDIPGFVTARIISMIINEAYFTYGEEVSTKEEIDTAMKLGTNYPYGPFEWGRLIGLKNVYALLKKLSGDNQRYAPAPLLEKEVLAG